MFDFQKINDKFLWVPDLDSFNNFKEKLEPSSKLPEICFFGIPTMDTVEFARLNKEQKQMTSLELMKCSIVDVELLPQWIEKSEFFEVTVLRINGKVSGWMETTALLSTIYVQEREKNRLQQIEIEEKNLDLKSIFETTFDEIFVADSNGITLKVSSALEKILGIKAENIIGKSVYELEKERIFNPSVTRLVLESKEKVSVIQKTNNGRILLATGVPIKDKDGRILRVVSGSRDITEIERLQKELAETRSLIKWYKKQLDDVTPNTTGKIIYQSPQMERLMEQAKRVAEVDSTVLITGESGVGKEGLAEFIHLNSSRSDKPFVKINCGSISESLIESELFGYERGAFTGASKDGKIGLIEASHQGTLFLDEIGELPLNFQVKLLRVLQEREITRVGSTVAIKVDIRIIAATNRDLIKEIEKGTFREDLYYRLNIIPMHLPPLRERKEDIVPLIHYFQGVYNARYHLNKQFSNQVIHRLLSNPWNGNIRELKNTIERLIVLSDGQLIKIEDLPLSLNPKEKVSAENAIEVRELLPLKTAKTLLEKKIMELATQKYSTISEIAKVLEVNQSTISRIVKKVQCKNA
ncbi:sigma 54-interacting transcriptional regulator [Bacillus sp. JJ1532]|uniref:sigma-54 interaction domain-containing protein n=1 Tax=Bacillus sp. JJ1532 TaxID=3122958 RepID=UPI0030008CAD